VEALDRTRLPNRRRPFGGVSASTLEGSRDREKVVFDLKPHQAESHEQTIHEHGHQGLAAHAVAG
jgi:hypothetical protein